MYDTVDFRRSLPPIAPCLRTEFALALKQLADEQDLGALMHESVARADDESRISGARYFACRLGDEVSPDRVMVTNSTQSALFMLLRELIGSSGLLLTETITYGALRPVLQKTSTRVVGIPIDAEGITPGGLEKACRLHKPKALYCNPTLHNPTTAIMSLSRRQQIIAIARKFGVVIIEDEALGWLRPDAPPPLAALAPEQCWYIMSTTKRLSHGLRLAYLAAPNANAVAKLLESAGQLSFWIPSPLITSVMQLWTQNGIVERVSGEIAAECMRRETVANQVLSGFDIRAPQGTMHIWLNLPAVLQADDFAALAQAHGILLRPASHFSVEAASTTNAVRLSLSTPNSVADVQRGLETLRALLQDGSTS